MGKRKSREKLGKLNGKFLCVGTNVNVFDESNLMENLLKLA